MDLTGIIVIIVAVVFMASFAGLIAYSNSPKKTKIEDGREGENKR
jgi:hypothetical protein